MNMEGLLMVKNTQSISTEVLLQLIADPTRQEVIRILQDHDEPTLQFGELASEVTGGEATSRDDGRTRNERVRVALHHTHLPKLAQSDVIVYNRTRKTVTAGAAFDTAETLLTATESIEAEHVPELLPGDE